VKLNHGAVIVSTGLLGLSFLLGGCGGATSSSPIAQGIPPAAHRINPTTCAPTTNTANFNGTPIPPGSWIWFTSVFSVPGYNGPMHLSMQDSTITFTAGSQTYTIDTPGSGSTLSSSSTVNLAAPGSTGVWQLTAPYGTSGNDFLNAVRYYTASGLPGGIKNVTWTAEFFHPVGATAQPIHWQWAAAVYSQFGLYKNLGVKPLDDNHYPPYNSDHAGTPENFKQYVIGGATGGGGSNYTGSYSGTVTVTPCEQ
jgi:hypothetical protein